MEEFLDKIFNKSKILIVDDDEINRLILGSVLEEKFEILYATNGQEALDIINKTYDISLIMLDIVMPIMDGFEVLKHLKEFGKLETTPVIVLTSEKEFELKCLRMGAADFIKKPFDAPEIINARVDRIVELYKDKSLIDSVNEDALTGLLKIDFFIEYSRQYAKTAEEKNLSLDFLSININSFHLVNQMNGKLFGDKVLKDVANVLREYFIPLEGICSHARDDQFYVCSIRQDSYENLAKTLHEKLGENITFRIGVAHGDLDENVKDLLTKARGIANAYKNDFTKVIAYYDKEFEKEELRNQGLVNDFPRALKEKEFVINIQPKYNIQGDKFYLAGGEALIRWVHPTLGFISPGVFIPLFEKNGLIIPLDLYVYEETAKVIRRIKDEFDLEISISVNVSRIDLFNPNLESYLLSLVEKYQINIKTLHLEITESAYTSDVTRVIELVKRFRKDGFEIELDDFGSGYSALNMITELPFDVLKIDMGFVRNMSKGDVNKEIVKMIVQMGKCMNVTIISEGVEDLEQVMLLKSYGCDLIQGYYFSKPLPVNQYLDLVKKEYNK